MSTAKWSAPSGLSSSLVTTELDSLANGSESAQVTYDNSANLNLYASITVKLGSITPSANGYITLRVVTNDGTNTADKAAGDTYTAVLASGTSAKIVIFPMVRIYPFSLRFSIINNSGVALAAASNGVYANPYNESVA
jgi:hypothetical protein